MKRLIKYILSIIGLTVVLLFCMSASTGLGAQINESKALFSEPMSMVFVGVVLICAGQLLRNNKF